MRRPASASGCGSPSVMRSRYAIVWRAAAVSGSARMAPMMPGEGRADDERGQDDRRMEVERVALDLRLDHGSVDLLDDDEQHRRPRPRPGGRRSRR